MQRLSHDKLQLNELQLSRNELHAKQATAYRNNGAAKSFESVMVSPQSVAAA